VILTKGRFVLAIVAGAALAASHWGMYHWGHADGYGQQKSACQAAQIKGFEASMAQLQAMTLAASEQSQALGRSINARQRADQHTTRQLRELLHATSDERVNCLFNDGVMRQLAHARDRAAQAAAGGLDDPVPAPERAGE